MEYQELLAKYHLLQGENKRLREENQQLRTHLRAPSSPMAGDELASAPDHEEAAKVCEPSAIIPAPSPITSASSVAEKIALFISLFRGRKDILSSNREILIVSPFLRLRRTAQMIEDLVPAAEKGVSVTVITRPASDFKPSDQAPFRNALELFAETGIEVVHRSNIHQKFAVIDKKIVWYGSNNLLSFGSGRESLMRIESAGIARELEKTVDYSSQPSSLPRM